MKRVLHFGSTRSLKRGQQIRGVLLFGFSLVIRRPTQIYVPDRRRQITRQPGT